MSHLQIDFEKMLTELGLTFSVHYDGFYTISSRTHSENHSVVRLISSLPVDKLVHGSKNGNEVQGIGVFKFKFPPSGHDPDILGFVFHNSVKNRDEFLLVPSQEFLRRRFNMNLRSVSHKSIVVVFWLMEDECVYDTTNMSVEGEWCFMSKGVDGRLADRSGLDYSEYMNNWRRLIV